MAVLYIWIYSSVLGCDLPKTAVLKKVNARWSLKMDIMNSQLDRYEASLEAIRVRDDDV